VPVWALAGKKAGQDDTTAIAVAHFKRSLLPEYSINIPSFCRRVPDDLTALRIYRGTFETAFNRCSDERGDAEIDPALFASVSPPQVR